MRRRRKPDLMMLLVVTIGLGVVVSGYAFDLGKQPQNAGTTVMLNK